MKRYTNLDAARPNFLASPIFPHRVLTMLSLLNPKAETIRRGQALQVCAFEEDAF